MSTDRLAEIRVDPLSGHRTVVAAKRASRPGGGFSLPPSVELDPLSDPFAEGNEGLTPPELYAVRPGIDRPNSPGWRTRVVPNLYPALTPDSGDVPRQADQELFFALPARGSHEVIVNGPQPVTTLAELPPDQLVSAMETWRVRIGHHSGSAAYVHLIVNEGRQGGASLPHTHAQLYALDFVPAAVARERERFSAYAAEKMGSNLLADLVQAEVKLGERVVAVDEEAVLLAPYASRVPYQLMLVPRLTRPRFEDGGPLGARLLKSGLEALASCLGGACPPLNMWVRTAPRGADHFCWRIDILPRLTHLAGLELGAEIALNIVAPESAAAELRAAI